MLHIETKLGEMINNDKMKVTFYVIMCTTMQTNMVILLQTLLITLMLVAIPIE